MRESIIHIVETILFGVIIYGFAFAIGLT